jgi:hypothetical protein
LVYREIAIGGRDAKTETPYFLGQIDVR